MTQARTVTFRKDNKASEGGSILKWIIGIGVIVALYMMFGSGTPPKQTSTPVQSTYSTNAPASNVAQPSAKQGNQELAFEIPPVGRDNILNLPQLRWYVREKIRIETMRNLASNNRAIGEFNAMVDNFNSRCGNFRYKQGLLTRAQADIDAIKDQIIADAKRDAKVRGW